MNSLIIETIKKYEKPKNFTHVPVTDEMIKMAEQELNVKLPLQFVEFLKLYGHGGICGIRILGVGLTGRMIFVEYTKEYRVEGLPENLVVVENVDEYLTCIDCNTERIVSWDYTGYIKDEYSCFDEYLIDIMNDAIENL